MKRRPPTGSTRTDTLFPYTALCRSRTPSSALGSWRHSAATTSRSSAPANTSASPSRLTLALLLGSRVQLALAQLGGDLCDRLVLQLLVELLAERLHERHALDHHVEHLPLPAGLAHQVVDRDRFAIAAQHLAGDLHAQAAR